MLFQSHSICPVCASPGRHWCTTYDWEYRSTTDSYTYLQCPDCFTLFIEEVPQASLQAIYPANYYSFSGRSSSPVFKLKDWWDRQYFTSLLKNIEATKLSVLDVGGGTGDVLDTLKKADKRISYTEIVDIDAAAGIAATHKGHVYTQSAIENYSVNRKFHVVLLLNIIEHIADPAGMIKKAGELLHGGGIIIIKTPNASSLDARMFRHHYWGGLHCPRHWIIFTNDSFRKMMSTLPLTISRLSFTQGAPFWTYSVLQFFRKNNISAKKKPLINHTLFSPISLFFAVFDLCRRYFTKTSQMFIVLKR